MRKMKIFLSIVISISIVLSSSIAFRAYDTTGEYCGLDLDNFYLPNLPSVNDAPSSYTTLSSYDPRSLNGTTHIKDQGNFGTCSLFATTAAFESAVYKETGLKSSYSEEAMRMC